MDTTQAKRNYHDRTGNDGTTITNFRSYSLPRTTILYAQWRGTPERFRKGGMSHWLDFEVGALCERRL